MTGGEPASGSDPGSDVVADGGLAEQVARGAAWVTLSRLGGQMLQFATGIVLARYLAPADFGVYVSVTVVTVFVTIFFEFGMTGALIQQEDLREEDLGTVFWLNALGGVVFAGLMLAVGPLLASFFGNDDVADIAPLVALSFTLHLGVCHQALLERALRFGRLTVVELTSNVLGFTASIGLAVAGAGVYALAVGPVVATASATIGFWIARPWRPHTFIRRASIARIWRFSSGLVGFQVVDYWGSNLDNALLGRFAGLTSLGLYNRAYNFMQIPVLQVGMVLGRVVFPALSLMRDDPVRAAQAYARAVRLISAVILPVLGGVAVVAPALVPLLWGQRWVDMVPLLILLCVAGMPLAIASSTSWVYQAMNRTDVQFKVGLATAGVGVAAIIIGIQWGALGVAWAVVFRSWSMFVPQMYVVGRVAGLGLTELVVAHWGAVAATGVMIGATAALPLVLGWSRSSPGVLIAQILVGAAVYAGASLVSQRSAVEEMRTLAARFGRR